MHMQGTVEGGFMGRTNKLVDGCYSYWQGGLYNVRAALPPQPPQQLPAGAPGQPAGVDSMQPALPPACEKGQQRDGAAALPPRESRRIAVPPLPRLSGRSLLQHSRSTANVLGVRAASCRNS